MRVCPNCGHADPFWWRPRKSRVYCEYTKCETLEYNDSALMAKIRNAHPEYYFDGHFIYHITKSGLNVERIEKELYDFMRWGAEPQEKVDHSSRAMMFPLTKFMEKETDE